MPEECSLAERDDENTEVTNANDDISEGENGTVPRPSGQEGYDCSGNSDNGVACLTKQKKRKQKKDTTAKKSKTRIYKMGVSIAPVGTRGKIPEGAYCLQKTTRGLWPTVKNSWQKEKKLGHHETIPSCVY